MKKLNFRLQGQKIFPAYSVKYLGVLIDQHLSWTDHINALSDKLRRATGLLAKLRHYTRQSLSPIYYALFDSHLKYGCHVWGQNTAITNRVKPLQEKAVKVINFKNFDDPVEPSLIKHQILKLDDFIHLKNCIFAHNFNKNNLPNSFNNFLSYRVECHSHKTRAITTGQLDLPHARTTFGSNTLKFRISSDWNLLQTTIKKEFADLRKSKLKTLLRAHYFNSYS